MVRYTQHPDLDDGLARKFREEHVELFENGSFIATNNEQVVKSFEINGAVFVIKRYSEKGARANIRSLLGVSRAMNSFRKSVQLSSIGVKTPDHLFVARHPSFLAGTSYLIMKKSIGVQLTDKIDDLIQSIHQAGITHGDLHAANIFVLPDLSLELIDLDNMRPNRCRQAKDLARILRSLSHRSDLQEQLSLILRPQS